MLVSDSQNGGRSQVVKAPDCGSGTREFKPRRPPLLHYQTWGEPSAQPLLMLHGHPGSAAAMAVFAEALSERYWCIAPDLRGYGRSRAQQPFSLLDQVAEVQALVEYLNLSTYSLLGWSLGGILSLELASQAPARCQSLILVASAAQPRGNHPPITWQDNAYTVLVAIANLLQPGHPWLIEHWGKRSLLRYLICQHTPTAYRYIASCAVPAYLQTSRHAHTALRIALNSPYRPDLGRLTCPVLVLAGAADCHITAASSAATAAALPQAAFIEYGDTAHLFPWEIPTQVQADIGRWLEKIELA